jgi:hypothetical protein
MAYLLRFKKYQEMQQHLPRQCSATGVEEGIPIEDNLILVDRYKYT